MAFKILDGDFSDTASINSLDTTTISKSSEIEQTGEFHNIEEDLEHMYTVDPYQFEPVASDSDKDLSYGIDSDSEENSRERQLLNKNG